ncbi:hypothetical protein M0805_007355 [Coniferiporia weirii]|nr:hypothetical protein M0805_007355 [Coniferiporia weirii]
MDANSNALLGRLKNANDTSHAYFPKFFSSARNVRPDVRPLRSPFSKLASSNCNSQTAIGTQSHQLSIAGRPPRSMVSETLSLRTPEHEHILDSRYLLQGDPKTDGQRHFVQSLVTVPRAPGGGGNESTHTRSPHPEPNESDVDKEFGVLFCVPSNIAQNSQRSLKKEVDATTPPELTRTRSCIEKHDEALKTLDSGSVDLLESHQSHESAVIDFFDHITRCSSAAAPADTQENIRSSSIVAPVKAQPADDLSTLMFKGATDLRNAKLALEEQAKEMSRMQDELNAVKAEKNELSSQFELFKRKAKEGLNTSAKQLGDMDMLLQALKSQSRNYFPFIEETREAMVNIENMKITLKEYAKRLETSVGDDGTYIPTHGWRNILDELRQDASNKQQVIDMFRDRLEFSQGELVVAKHRAAELENMQSQNNFSLEVSSEKMAVASEKLTKLAVLLRDQQRQNLDILVKNADMEARLNAYNNEISDLKECISKKDKELQTTVSLQEEVKSLYSLVKDQEGQLTGLREIEQKLLTTAALYEDRGLKIEALEASAKSKSESLAASQKSLSQVETQLTNERSLIQRLECDLKESRTLVKSEFDFRLKAISEKEGLRIREQNLISEVDILKKETEEYKIRLCQSETRLEMLQERFDDQSLMLRTEKKAQGDMQECLFAAQMAFNKTMEEARRTSELQTIQYRERIKILEVKVQDHQEEASTIVLESASKLAEMEAKNARQAQEMNEAATAKADEAARVQKDLDSAKAEAQLFQKRIQSLQQEKSELGEKLADLKLPSEAHLQELLVLRDRIKELQNSEELKTQRARSIVLRYECGDLSIEEKRLIDTIHRASQASHEQQLIAKANEIRQRDNAMRALEKRKSELEAQLARILNTQARTKADPDIMNRSRALIDPNGWVSSQSSGSPFGNGSVKAPDKDKPTTIIDVETAANSPATIRSPVVKAHINNIPPPPAVVASVAGITQNNINLSFAQVAARSSDWIGDKELDGIYPSGSVVTAKRKRASAISTGGKPGNPRPPRRAVRDPVSHLPNTYFGVQRTTANNVHNILVDVAEGESMKISAAPTAPTAPTAPKAKMRKRR